MEWEYMINRMGDFSYTVSKRIEHPRLRGSFGTWYLCRVGGIWHFTLDLSQAYRFITEWGAKRSLRRHVEAKIRREAARTVVESSKIDI